MQFLVFPLYSEDTYCVPVSKSNYGLFVNSRLKNAVSASSPEAVFLACEMHFQMFSLNSSEFLNFFWTLTLISPVWVVQYMRKREREWLVFHLFFFQVYLVICKDLKRLIRHRRLVHAYSHSYWLPLSIIKQVCLFLNKDTLTRTCVHIVPFFYFLFI